uniref:Uncharacterized protein n=1 Tax=Peronospora matthiolae TaxID=2874970 RepID=A0AAV1UB00_9STRA
MGQPGHHLNELSEPHVSSQEHHVTSGREQEKRQSLDITCGKTGQGFAESRGTGFFLICLA